jgi:transposase
VVMEACGSAHYWARVIAGMGHDIVLLPPHLVRPYVQGNKTDKADAKGILEAFRNDKIRPVPVKSPEQQMLVSLHRLRSAYVWDRTARINTLRGLLREFGFIVPLGSHGVVPTVRELMLNPETDLAPLLRTNFLDVCDEIVSLEERTQRIEDQLKGLAKLMPLVQHLLSIPGIGLITATALVAFVGDMNRFPTARHFASFLGLTPRERSSGNRRRLGGISKRGDRYLRTLLIHGARAALLGGKRSKTPDRLRTWALQVARLRGHNRAAVALANKIARIVWAVWRSDSDFVSVAVAA